MNQKLIKLLRKYAKVGHFDPDSVKKEFEKLDKKTQGDLIKDMKNFLKQ